MIGRKKFVYPREKVMEIITLSCQFIVEFKFIRLILIILHRMHGNNLVINFLFICKKHTTGSKRV